MYIFKDTLSTQKKGAKVDLREEGGGTLEVTVSVVYSSSY